ncbi:hypothetical protein CHS0354_041764 [Potamilus streckersoni]|uniref:Fatty acid desaturase domain-containing protein n=1 Tax=Potamilus streckersoni TaxID=2493646 RepID=A0AAE0W4K6_9BIVA|nr:hypothetical protein CHS0354_041764 [Potamilus streckersoni]
MAPKSPDIEIIEEGDNQLGLEAIIQETSASLDEQKQSPPLSIVWKNVFVFAALHIAAVYAISLIPSAHPLTWLWTICMYHVSGLGITAGSHRLWSHRSYKAKLPLRILLAFMQTSAVQNDIIEWARDHRVHHKYTETHADPHNANRGFFFAHIGWLLVKKHPDVCIKGKQLDLSDLYADPVCRLQRRYYKILAILICFVIPTIVPNYLWGERLWTAFFLAGILRYCAILNATWLVNSAAHIWGMHPYDKRINPGENPVVSFGACGEGFHNYHHVFPHDYSTSEYGWKLNVTTLFIDTMAAIGQAYDLKKVSLDAVRRRRERTGDMAKED